MAFNKTIQLDNDNVLELKGGFMRTHLKILHNGEQVGRILFLLPKGKFEKTIAGHLVRLKSVMDRGTGHISLTTTIDGETVSEDTITQ